MLTNRDLLQQSNDDISRHKTISFQHTCAHNAILRRVSEQGSLVQNRFYNQHFPILSTYVTLHLPIRRIVCMHSRHIHSAYINIIRKIVNTRHSCYCGGTRYATVIEFLLKNLTHFSVTLKHPQKKYSIGKETVYTCVCLRARA